jgi:hypothetical protein
MVGTFLVKISPELKLDWQSDYNVMRFKEFAKNNIGKVMRLEIPKPVRSLSQNALYWVYLKKISLETGTDSEDLHDFFKIKFLPKRIAKIKGKTTEHTVETVTSTTKLSKADFSEYMNKIERLTEVMIPTKAEAEEMGYISNY